MRAAITICAAVLFGALALLGAGVFSSPASAQATSTGQYARSLSDLETDERIFRMRKFLENTKPSDFNQPSEATRRQRVMTRSTRAKLPTLGPHLLKAGLASAAVGIWVSNAVSLYNATQCGQTTCEPLELSAEFRQALDESGARVDGGSANFKVVDYYGETTAVGMITSVKYTYDATNGCKMVMTGAGKFIGSTNAPVGTSSRPGDVRATRCSISGGFSSTVGTLQKSFSFENANTTSQPCGFRNWARDYNSTGGTVVQTDKYFGNGTCGLGYEWINPIYDWGETTLAAPGTAPASGSLGAGAQASNDVYDQTVADPEAPPKEDNPETEEDEELEPIETVPDFFPDEWEDDDAWKDIIEREFGSPSEWPNADPDGDEIPNQDDPDDDNDGIPDEEDDEPWGPPIEYPEADPDDDGDPNETDPDDDGDGIPDEVDPNPTEPDVDTDGDQDPDETDPDDDGDGIPDEDDPDPLVPTDPGELPDDHPYADPDEDGIPNKDDPDDDGDGIPDEADPDPHTPTPPSELPDEHPYADPDEDGDPNRIDRDDDGDGAEDWEEDTPYDPTTPDVDPNQDQDLDDVPDWQDPWPGNPHAPARPLIDTDTDGTPDYIDPEPADQDVPWKPSRPNPGNPNMPANPTNPNRPPSTTPANPTDPSNPTDPDTGLDPSNPDSPTVPGTPDPPPAGLFCPIAPAPMVDLPSIPIDTIFPFSLIIYWWGLVSQLGSGGGSAPSFQYMGYTASLSGWETGVGYMRSAMGVIMVGGTALWFYRYITGKGSDG